MGNATACAQTIVAELVALGVREVVLAPGSRSAPLAYALFAADRDAQLRLHVRIDERTAGFLAVGLARAGGAPVAVVTTSGTAAANLHPAVLEGWHSHLPLIMITADRPRSMINTGANQTTHQDQLFVSHLRGSAALSDATDDPPTWRFELSRLVVAATGARSRLPGPVHVNVELSDPLAPVEVAAPPRRPPTAITSSPAPIRVLVDPGPRTVVVAGDAPPEAGREIARVAAAAGLPLLAEPSSNARSGPTAIAAYRLLLGTELAEQVERVVVIGHPTLSRPLTRLLSRSDVELVVVSPYADWVDPGRRASQVVDAVAFADGDPGDVWLATWQRRDAELAERLDRLLADQTVLSGPEVARTLWAALGDDDLLFVGASNPVRDLDLAPHRAAHPTVFANRGLSGIDGSVSTTLGIALAAGRPTSALLGDVTTLHDLTGLILGPDEPRPDVRIVVANDDGGSIFATLEHGAPEHAAAFERVFGTPHRVRLASVAEAVGAAYCRVTDRAGLADAVRRPPAGLEIVEAAIDRAGRRRLDQEITGLAATL